VLEKVAEKERELENLRCSANFVAELAGVPPPFPTSHFTRIVEWTVGEGI
jgi:hypothetical protein